MLNATDIASNISADLYINGNFTAGRGDPPIVVTNPYDNRQITALPPAPPIRSTRRSRPRTMPSGAPLGRG
jgi:hypothetical protein